MIAAEAIHAPDQWIFLLLVGRVAWGWLICSALEETSPGINSKVDAAGGGCEKTGT